MLYGITTYTGRKTFPLGTYLGEVTDTEKVDFVRGLHPTIARALLFKSLQRAKFIVAFLNDEYEEEGVEFYVVEVDEDLDDEHRVTYHW